LVMCSRTPQPHAGAFSFVLGIATARQRVGVGHAALPQCLPAYLAILPVSGDRHSLYTSSGLAALKRLDNQFAESETNEHQR
jgi:hypothetical protein